MPANRLLIDTSYLVALHNKDDKYHRVARLFSLSLSANNQFLLPMVVLTEAAYLVKRETGQHGLERFLRSVRTAGFVLEPVVMENLSRVGEILTQYHDNHFDFVDCCLMAAAERLNVRQICTFDRRDFSVFRPKQADPLQLLP